jgi:hypothetical protein
MSCSGSHLGITINIKNTKFASKIIGCRKNILSIFVAFLTFYKFIIKKKKKKISHFKMPTLNNDVTVNSYNNSYLFSMK